MTDLIANPGKIVEDLVIIPELPDNVHAFTAISTWANEAKRQGVPRDTIEDFKSKALKMKYEDIIAFIGDNSFTAR